MQFIGTSLVRGNCLPFRHLSYNCCEFLRPLPKASIADENLRRSQGIHFVSDETPLTKLSDQ